MEPSDEELLELMSQQFRDDLATVSRLASYGTPVEPGIYRVSLNTGALDFARAVLARYGHQPAPPTEGEVADLIAWLGDEADQYDCIQQSAETSHKLRRAAYLLAHHHPAPPTEGEVGELIERLNLISVGMDAMGHESDSWLVARAADLLEQCHPTPVPVSERLPEPGTKVLAHYCNALGKGRTICAIWVPAKSRSNDADFADDDFTEYDEEDDKFYWPEGWYEAIENWDDFGWIKVYEGEVIYWQPLPAWPALPLPALEVE